MLTSDHIGRYEILETLAGGGQGTVYLGREEGSEEVVAIKVMHPGHTGEALYLDALRREANLATRLEHPNVTQIQDFQVEDGAAYLTFPSNQTAQVFTTTLGGKLVHTLNAPNAGHDFSHPRVNEYFDQGNGFVPTDVEQLDGLFYITTGYSKLDYVLTARILSLDPFQAAWYDLVFGGKGKGAGEFSTGHGITVPTGTKRIDVADRANSEIDRFTRYGHYRSTLKLPEGSFPCDVDYIGNNGIVGCLHGPDRSQGAPVYILEGDEVVSTVMPKEELGLENFQHIHNAVFRKIGEKHYIIIQAWNPGDFAILEQVTE